MERRNFIGATLAALTVAPAHAAAEDRAPTSTQRSGLVVTTEMGFSAYIEVYLNGVKQSRCVMAQEGLRGTVVQYAVDADGRLITDAAFGCKHEISSGYVTLKLASEAPPWAHEMLKTVRREWA